MDENNTNNFAKKPIKGGIPAIDSKQIIKLRLKIGLLLYWFVSSEMYFISLITKLFLTKEDSK